MERKKLFIVRPSLGQGGADRNTLILLQLLDRRLFDISLVLMRKEGEFVAQVPADVEVLDLGASSLRTAWWPLARLLRRHRPDIVLSTSGGANSVAVVADILARRSGRLVLSERNTVDHGERTAKRRLLNVAKRLLYPRADEVTVVSKCVGRDVEQTLGVRTDKITVVFNPVVDETLLRSMDEPLPHPWFADDVPVVLAAGRFVPQKDYPTLLRAFQKVRSGREARLLILGEGPLREELEALVRELGLEGDVEMPGFDPNPFRYMSRCAVFVLSSRHEGLVNVLIQAMACGAAVISTDCPCGPSEIISDPDRDGILVQVGDVTGLAERLSYLLDHPAARKEMGANARKSSTERFGADAIVRAYTSAILGVTDGGSVSDVHRVLPETSHP